MAKKKANNCEQLCQARDAAALTYGLAVVAKEEAQAAEDAALLALQNAQAAVDAANCICNQ